MYGRRGNDFDVCVFAKDPQLLWQKPRRTRRQKDTLMIDIEYYLY